MKRIIAFVLSVMMLLTASTALAWNCTNCGAAMDGKFCSECGSKKPETICPVCGTNHGDKALNFCTECGARLTGPAPTATPVPVPTATPALVQAAPVISQVFENGNGSVSLLWDADGETKYTIECIQRLSDDPEADRNANGGFFASEGKNSIGFMTITRLIPGERYWLGLFDEQGRGGYIPYEPAAQPGAFSEFAITPEVRLMIERDGVQTEAAPLTVQDVTAGEKIGLYVAFNYENPGEAKDYITQIVIKAPNGACWVMAGTAKFKEAMTGVTGWKFLNLADYFNSMQAGFGKVLAGDYSVMMYVNGALVGEVPLRVEEAVAAATQAPSKVEWISLTNKADGSVDVSWGGGVPPYKVRYMEMRSGDYEADKNAEGSFGQWIAADEVTENTYNLLRLAPGRSYWISVVDANGMGRYTAYNPEAVQPAEGVTATLEIIPRSQEGEIKTNLPFIPANKVGQADDVSHGAYIWLDYNNTGAERKVLIQLVLTLQNGATRVEKMGTATLESGEKQLGWNFCDLEFYFERVIANFGAVPEGDIQVEFYLDGKLAASGVLPVYQEKPLNITGCTQQEDGTVVLSWEDNGNGPFGVYYHERFTEDSTADRNDSRSTGRWIAEEDLTGTSLRIMYLIPGRNYWITLEDSMGGKTILPYDAPALERSALNMTISTKPQVRKNDQVTGIAAFSASKLAQDDGASYGIGLELNYTAPAADGQAHCVMALTTPGGVTFCNEAFTLNLFASGSTYWVHLSLDWAFKNLARWYDSVPTGEYTFTVYVEGEYAAETTFTVGK